MSQGVKGSDVYATTGDPLLDLSVGCVRGADPSALQRGLEACLESPTCLEEAAVLAFHVRNIRGGKGERDVFQTLFHGLWKHDHKLVEALIDLVPAYGCWDDLVRLAPKVPLLIPKILDVFEAQLKEDVINAADPDASLSLCAKWAPRECRGAKSDRALATLLSQRLFPHKETTASRMAAYRKCLSALNQRLKTVEIKMCGGSWADIDPSAVPGRAGKKYNRAFLNLPTTYNSHESVSLRQFRHPKDADRVACREHFVEHYAKAAKGAAKVHGADTLFPHEVVRKADANPGTEEEQNHLLAVWRSMVTKAQAAGGLGRSIFMSDFSGSMRSAPNVGDTPYWVSMALGLLGAEIASGEFKNKLMTFDSTPQWLTFDAEDDLFIRLAVIQKSRAGCGLSTDFQKAMDLVLATLKEKRVKPGEEPENLIVLTDMGWDQACGSHQTSVFTGNSYRYHVKTEGWQTHVEMIRESFKRAGEDMWGPGQGFAMPRIVIWNLAATASSDFHATAETPGVAMLSGWSATQFDVLMKEGPRQITPAELLRIELENPAYDRVRQRVRSHLKVGPLEADRQ